MGAPVPQQLAGSSLMIKCKYQWEANICVHPLLEKGVQTHLVPTEVLGCQAELLVLHGEWYLGKERTHERRGGWEKWKMGDSKITRSFAVCLAEFG